MDSLDKLVEQGKVLYLGISNTSACIVAGANQYAVSGNKTPFSIYQGRWNLLIRDTETNVVPMCRHHGMAIAPWDAIGGGKFQPQIALVEHKEKGESLRSLMDTADHT